MAMAKKVTSNNKARKPIVDKNDLNLFYKAIIGAKPLIQNKIRLSSPLCSSKVNEPVVPSPSQEKLKLAESFHVPCVSAEEFISFKHPGLSHQILYTLRKGQYHIEAQLDLHGMTVDKAQVSLEHFLQDCLDEGIRTVLIIHGKGRQREQPILKNKLNRWLRKTTAVLAFCSATALHGNRGAIYVLLNHDKGGEKI